MLVNKFYEQRGSLDLEGFISFVSIVVNQCRFETKLWELIKDFTLIAFEKRNNENLLQIIQLLSLCTSSFIFNNSMMNQLLDDVKKINLHSISAHQSITICTLFTAFAERNRGIRDMLVKPITDNYENIIDKSEVYRTIKNLPL